MRFGLGFALLSTIFAGSLSAQGGPGGMPLDDAAFQPTIPMLTGMLQLTPEQVARVGPLRDTLLAESRTARERAATLQAAVRSARQRGAPADSQVQLQEELRTAMQRLMPWRLAFHARVRALLTPAQAELMDQRQQEQMQRMHGTPPR
ncbi:MAG TPA: hypothetical protein PKA50_13400 [Gemmatimonadales bacterium]|nr:hypothetical protein [Gemmatimonadales bacterium]